MTEYRDQKTGKWKSIDHLKSESRAVFTGDVISSVSKPPVQTNEPQDITRSLTCEACEEQEMCRACVKDFDHRLKSLGIQPNDRVAIYQCETTGKWFKKLK